jgi:cysteine desulfurase
MRKQLKIPPIIFGTQNDGFRGGTENIPGIGASFTAVKLLHIKDNTELKKMIMFQLSKHYPCVQYTKYTNNIPIQIVFLSGATEYYLNNTLLLSVVKNTKPYICNSKIKEYLEKKGIIISVGSACNTSSKKASHVLYAMGVDKYIRKGALRISLGCNTTYNDINAFINVFLEAIKQQL